MKLVLISPDMNLGWVMMSLNTGILWLTPGTGGGGGGGRREEEKGSDCKGRRWCGHEGEVSKKEAWEGHELLRRAQ